MRDRPSSVFFDASISFRLCGMIDALEEHRRSIVHATNHPKLQAGANRLGNSTPDVAWIKILGDDDLDWVAISGDTKIVDTPHEREALKNSGITFFAFDRYFTNADRYGQALQLVQMWPRIIQATDACQLGIFIVRPKK